MTAGPPEGTGSCLGEPSRRASGRRRLGSRLSLLQFLGCRGENPVATLSVLASVRASLPPWGELSPREPRAPTPAKPYTSQVGVRPSTGLRMRGAFRGGEGARKLSFCLDASGNSEHQLLPRTHPKIALEQTLYGALGVLFTRRESRAPVRIGRFPKEPPFQSGPWWLLNLMACTPNLTPSQTGVFPKKARRRRKEDGD